MFYHLLKILKIKNLLLQLMFNSNSTWFLNDIYLPDTNLKLFTILCKYLPFGISLLAGWTPRGITGKKNVANKYNHMKKYKK